MSRLRGILDELLAGIPNAAARGLMDDSQKVAVVSAEERIIELMLELIGELELSEPSRPGHNIDVGARNGLRLELRQKANEL